ncbi:putative E3 ubiquitin-protein ligase RING1a [Vigna unguiculata]|uniref:putative E3 ubiquitin-protein ligase RING1a n=1 Tax=Vigna unguiculata TaxID=3917 RepID=UPI0010164ED2|nr:putative E3 ubiquitin-protein ligase RING1a [Vigna unguiculata]
MSGPRLPDEPPPEQPGEEVQSENEVESDLSNSSSDDDICMEIDLSDISEDLKCPICLGVIRKTKIVMECLHRFCGECIEKAIRLCKNECPVCREHFPGGCTLGDDRHYDHLISIIHPDVAQYEDESLQRQIEELERKHKVKATAVSFARRRRTIRNACKDEKGNEKNEVMNDKNAGKESSSDAQKTESEPNKDGESATLHADGTADENVPEK